MRPTTIVLPASYPTAASAQTTTARPSNTYAVRPISRRASIALWIVQVSLAALFLFAGTMKFVIPVAEMTKQMPLPGSFLHFIGAAEIAGALGLVLPGLFRIRQQLTPLAARGLVIIMSGAVGITMAGGQIAPALVPLVVGVLAGCVAQGRSRA
jgi:uncharacterized membrane protein YphA (DoxX/SURF4 family)